MKEGGNSNSVSSKLFGQPSGCESGSVKNTYGLGCEGLSGVVSRIVMSPMIPSVAKSASPSPISLPRDSKALSTASALLFAISSSPDSLCSFSAFAIASRTPKSSRPADSSAVTGLKIGKNMTMTRRIATLLESRGCGTPRWSMRTLSDDINYNWLSQHT